MQTVANPAVHGATWKSQPVNHGRCMLNHARRRSAIRLLIQPDYSPRPVRTSPADSLSTRRVGAIYIASLTSSRCWVRVADILDRQCLAGAFPFVNAKKPDRFSHSRTSIPYPSLTLHPSAARHPPPGAYAWSLVPEGEGRKAFFPFQPKWFLPLLKRCVSGLRIRAIEHYQAPNSFRSSARSSSQIVATAIIANEPNPRMPRR